MDVSGKAARESTNQLTVETELEDSREDLMEVPVKLKVSVFLTKILFAMMQPAVMSILMSSPALLGSAMTTLGAW